jgi:molecular chaperone DnaK (HSP70)
MTTDAPLAIGIDLGTTNSALASASGRGQVEIFEIPQLVARGEMGRAAVLPSFVYLPDDSERGSGAFGLPWEDPSAGTAVVGLFAREHGALVPSRQIASSKSWLVNASVDRTAPILPWGAEGVRRLSPVDASARIVEHLRRAWDYERAASDDSLRLDRQSVVLTVPASFDEEARELTVEAARKAGLTSVRLLEEPLAALYAWIAAHRRLAAEQLAHGDLILVCDVGGGTTDFTMIRTSIVGGEPRFERIAIGEHLLLGGDNVDLALAVLCEHKLAEHGAPRLTLAQRHTLRRKASEAKERLLADDGDAHARITLLGAGRGVVGGGMTTELTSEDVVRTLAEGFLPLTAPDDLPARDRRVALRELGLPFESDPAITRHLAGFLTRAAQANGLSGMLRPDAVLFNGGFFTPALPRTRVLDALAAWFGGQPRLLENARPEAAVAAGAAFYARLLQNPEAASRLLIRAGTARAYFIGVAASGESAGNESGRHLAVCVMPRGTQEGTTLSVDREFSVMTNRPLAFTLYSTTQREGRLNEIVAFTEDEDLRRHAPLVTALRYGKRSRSVPLGVQLRVAFTETGTLELWCESRETDHRWRLAFNLRSIEADPLGVAEADADGAASTGDEVVIEADSLARATMLIEQVFTATPGAPSPDALVGELEIVLGHGKQSWPLAAIRTLADALLKVEAGRRRGREFEIRWLNLTGFCARPGFGTALDAWRISELRKVYAAGLAFPKDVQAQVEWLVLWQRVSAGFSTGQQRELAHRVLGQLGAGQKKAPRVHAQIEREGWRLLANLERIDAGLRTKLGDELIDRVRREPKNPAWLWGVGRFGARAPLYGPLSSVVPPSVAERWIDRLLTLRVWIPDTADTVTRLTALTGDAARDVDPQIRQTAVQRLREVGCDEGLLSALVTVRSPDRREAARAFGESLPEGLHLENLTSPLP